ncbi:hypothetical protein ACS0TY_016559 [Phlomoides rotata]
MIHRCISFPQLSKLHSPIVVGRLFHSLHPPCCAPLHAQSDHVLWLAAAIKESRIPSSFLLPPVHIPLPHPNRVELERRGVIMLTFWPAIGERKYDWDRQKFALSATEVGTLIAWDSNDSCEFFHDPSMLSSNADQVRKSFSIKAHSGGTGYFFNLNVVNNVLKTNDRFTIPVTPAEFAVMRTAFTSNYKSKHTPWSPQVQFPKVLKDMEQLHL